MSSKGSFFEAGGQVVSSANPSPADVLAAPAAAAQAAASAAEAAASAADASAHDMSAASHDTAAAASALSASSHDAAAAASALSASSHDAAAAAHDTSAASSAAAAAMSAALSAVMPVGLRLTLTSGTSLTTADVVGATTVYATPHINDRVSIFDGASWHAYSTAELSLPLDSNSAHTGYHAEGKHYDVFAFLSGGAPVIGTGPDWTQGAVAGTSLVRGSGAGSTELQAVNGVWTNKNTITVRFGNAAGSTVVIAPNQATFLGSFRTTSDGVTEDSMAKRLLSNAYSRHPRPMLRGEPAGNSWVYATNSWRQVNANSANQLAVLNCLSGIRSRASVSGNAVASNLSGYAYVGIGIDSSTVNTAGISLYSYEAGSGSTPQAQYDGFLGLGYHEIRWLEYFLKTGGTGTVLTWYASDASADRKFSIGMIGETEA